MCVCVFMALITTLVLCARSQDLAMSVSVRREHVVVIRVLVLINAVILINQSLWPVVGFLWAFFYFVTRQSDICSWAAICRC